MNNASHNSSSQLHVHYQNRPDVITGNRRPRPSSAQQQQQYRSVTPPPKHNGHTSSSQLNTTSKLDQSILRNETDLNKSNTSIINNNNRSLNSKGKNRLYSTWTPLQDEETNAKFDKWTDEQRRFILDELMTQCRPKQLTFTRNLLTKKFPAQHQDFTRLFPRVLSLYIFSFLDPRSLCRCAQVSWFWKFLSESDQLWMPKCLRFGWTPHQTPSPHESCIWKRVYGSNIQALQTMPIRVGYESEYRISKAVFLFSYSQLHMQYQDNQLYNTHRSHSALLDNDQDKQNRSNLSSRQNTNRPSSGRNYHSNHSLLNTSIGGTSSNKQKYIQPPWRANSRFPTDTLRFNYLDNDDSVLETLIARKHKDVHQNFNTSTAHESDHEKDGRRSRTKDENNYSYREKRRSQSLSAPGSPSPRSRPYHDKTSGEREFGTSTLTGNYSFRPQSTIANRPDLPRPPSSQKVKYSPSKTFGMETSNRNWSTINDEYDDY
ncbi:unnamed protein product [Didymodactylos carnosus]|uniref:F-box domain-containing protein n=1 Tax=Didymodactylos carnosus TaxID=1234261 RepID=A0A813V913_9BILA|nr:unnamed protein product [Didymodactylos carnosus]CAF0839263.1 unnamed protein product [Didymodactylos carnosus]CAF3527029.1 unnamed protein product [Didymodactylos carnosus]CAF3626554.1 unnamed protein product [Didymodactylos carnosus]